MEVEDGYKTAPDGKSVHNLTPSADWALNATARYLVCRGDDFTHWRAVYEDKRNSPLVVHRMAILAGAYERVDMTYKPKPKATRVERQPTPDWLPEVDWYD